MRTPRRILVAVKDPQSKSLPSVAKATQLARAFGAEVELFHGLDVPLYIDTAGTADEGFRGLARDMRAQRLQRLEVVAARMRKHGVKVTTSVEWDFPIYEAIVRRATRTNADLIIAECRPGRHIAPMLLRLIDWELLRLSPVPVLLVKSTRAYRHPTILAAVDPSHAHAKPSKLDDDVLAAGAAFQSALRGTLHTVHAYAPFPTDTAYDSALRAAVTEPLMAQIKTHAQASFDQVLRKTHIPRTRRHLIGLPPQDAIDNVARETKTAIVVMGAVSRSGLKRIFIGNTAEQLLDDLTCDVLVIKPREFANRVPRAKRGIRLVAPDPMMPFY